MNGISPINMARLMNQAIGSQLLPCLLPKLRIFKLTLTYPTEINGQAFADMIESR